MDHINTNDILKTKGIRMVHINILSLSKHIDQVSTFLSGMDVIVQCTPDKVATFIVAIRI